jgi:hypothetical protein
MLLVGCSTVSVSSRYNEANPLPQKATYDWGASRDGAADTDRQIRKAVSDELAKRGYRKVEHGKMPDLLVTYDTDFEQKVVENELEFGFTGTEESVVQYGQSGPAVFPYDEGTLDIRVIDPRQERTVWEGVGTRIVDKPGLSEAQIDDSIAKMFEKFPIV